MNQKTKKQAGRSRMQLDEGFLERIVDQTVNADESKIMDFSRRYYPLIKLMFNPQVIGSENLPKKPALFVSNHSTLALDGFFLGPILHQEFGICARGLGDDFLFRKEGLAELLIGIGGTLGHEQVCTALMENKKSMIVFPGGAHEANKPVKDRYTLRWKERSGFIRLAAKHGYTIVPLAMVGPDEWFDRYIEPEDFYETRLGKMLISMGVPEAMRHPDVTPPIIKGLFGTAIPRPIQSYLGIGKPLDLSEYQGMDLDKKTQMRLRKKVADQVESTIADLLVMQAQQKESAGFIRKLLTI